MIVREAPMQHFSWIATRAGCAPSAGFSALEAVDDKGKIAAMVGYDLATPTMVQMHVAMEHPGGIRALLRPGFERAFDKGRKLALVAIPSTNRESRDFTEHLGFRETYRIMDGWDDGVDLVLYEMRRHECRFLEDAHG